MATLYGFLDFVSHDAFHVRVQTSKDGTLNLLKAGYTAMNIKALPLKDGDYSGLFIFT